VLASGASAACISAEDYWAAGFSDQPLTHREQTWMEHDTDSG
jgi:hypothetical protein